MYLFALFVAAGAATISFPNATFTNTSQSSGFSLYIPGPIGSSILADICESSFISSFFAWGNTAALTTIETIPASTIAVDKAGDTITTLASLALVASYKTISAYTTELYAYFRYQAEPPCCASCSVLGGNVQVFYWPLNASPQASTLVDASDFTFISPSIYVGFQSLYASNFCEVLGSTITATTIAFAPDELSTSIQFTMTRNSLMMPNFTYAFTAASYEENWNLTCTEITSSFWQVAFYQETFTDAAEAWSFADSQPTLSNFNYVAVTSIVNGLTIVTENGTSPVPSSDLVAMYTVTYNPCSPMLSVPTEIYSLNPAWTSCIPGIYAFFDPPYILSAGNGMSAVETATPVSEEQAVRASTKVASAGSTPVLGLPTPTGTQNNNPKSTASGTNDPPAHSPGSAAGNPPSNNDPQDPSPTDVSPISPPTPLFLTLGSSIITANSASEFILASQTLSPGSQITLSNTILSLLPNGKALIISDSHGVTTQTLSPASLPSPAIFYQINSQTLSAGGSAITVSGTVVSLLLGGSSVVIGGTTEPLSVLLTPSLEYLVGSQTLIAGGAAITISGTVISLLAGGESVVVGGTKTEGLKELLGPSPTTVHGVGEIVATIGGFAIGTSGKGGFGGGGDNETVFFGKASLGKGRGSIWFAGFIIAMLQLY